MKNVPRLHLTILFIAALIGTLLLGAALYCTAQKNVSHAIAPSLVEHKDRGRECRDHGTAGALL